MYGITLRNVSKSAIRVQVPTDGVENIFECTARGVQFYAPPPGDYRVALKCIRMNPSQKRSRTHF